LPIGHGQTNSQPTTVRHLLQWLDVTAGQRVLDVGSGSGWTTALLGHLVGPEGSVTGVEAVPDLVDFGRANLAAYPMPWVRIEPADPHVLGLPDEGPFDRILVSAESDTLPPTLVGQLAPGGVMVVPVAGRLNVVRRPEDPDAEPEVARHGYYRFVPLVLPREGQ
jgi:protein-L-isoaspartate(D-aspartate) O-methyltransferase